jgi:Recombination endonuclease VII
MLRKTAEQRQAYNAYMREFKRKPTQKAKDSDRAKARYSSLCLSDPVGHKKKVAEESRRRRWAGIVSPEEYDRRLAESKGVCALCGEPFDNTKLGQPALDHCHETMQVRDFVHARCNLGVGNLLHDPEICRRAAEYLERHKLEGLCMKN